MIRFAEKTEINAWDTHILANPDAGNLFQSYEFAQQKKLTRWQPLFVVADKLALTVLEKQVIGLGKLWYIPKGPGVTSVRELEKLLPELKKFAQQHGVFMVKIEPEFKKTNETVASLMKLGLVKTRSIQPNFSTIILDLSPDLDTVLARLNQKGRHAINRAKRDGVTAEPVPATDKNCEIMYKLLSETATGQFQIRQYSYFKSYWQRFEKAGIGQLFFAYFEGAIVASAYAIAFGTKGTYKDGASVRKRTAYGASHLLQWRVIQWMKEKGVTSHDLCGAPPSDRIKDPQHPHYGIGRFKTSFNKEVTDYIGAYDIIIKPAFYKIWVKLGERVMLRLSHTFHHESYF